MYNLTHLRKTNSTAGLTLHCSWLLILEGHQLTERRVGWAVTTTVKATKSCVMDSNQYTVLTILSLHSRILLFSDMTTHPNYHHLHGLPGPVVGPRQSKSTESVPFPENGSSVSLKQRNVQFHDYLFIQQPAMECRHCWARLLAESLKLTSQRMPKTWSQRQEALWGLLAPLDTMS